MAILVYMLQWFGGQSNPFGQPGRITWLGFRLKSAPDLSPNPSGDHLARGRAAHGSPNANGPDSWMPEAEL